MRASSLPMDFRGYIEADKIGYGDIDVVVTDGFTGNVALKTAEGIAKMISRHAAGRAQVRPDVDARRDAGHARAQEVPGASSIPAR